ncbi:hypothetical protein D3C74_441350 [compost metagenome]
MTGRDLGIEHRSDVLQGQHWLAVGGFDAQFGTALVFVVRPGRQGDLQVVAACLLQGAGLIDANAALQVADAILLLGLQVHRRWIDGLFSTRLCTDCR